MTASNVCVLGCGKCFSQARHDAELVGLESCPRYCLASVTIIFDFCLVNGL